MAKLNVLATYTVNIVDGVVTAVGDVPQAVLDFIQVGVTENWERWSKGQAVAKHDGNYQVTLYDTGVMEMIAEGAVGKAGIIYAEPAADAPRATTIEGWLELATTKAVQGKKTVAVTEAPAKAGDAETPGAPKLSKRAWQKVKAALNNPYFMEWLGQGTAVNPMDLAQNNPETLMMLYRQFQEKWRDPKEQEWRRNLLKTVQERRALLPKGRPPTPRRDKPERVTRPREVPVMGAFADRKRARVSRQWRPGWRPAPGVITPRTPRTRR